jgi:uncharacterized protein YdcH (DUF465 family)
MATVSEEHHALSAQDDEYRRLSEKHRGCDDRLRELQGKLLLTESEKIEEAALKKKKLNMKDRMEAIARRLRESVPS